MFILDTNHCSYAILGNAQVLDRLANLTDKSISTCAIVKGELIDMAERSRQRQSNLALVKNFREFTFTPSTILPLKFTAI